MADPSVAIIILNFNGRELLREYLPSISSLEYDNRRIMVVDNASTDGSVEFVRKQYPEIELVENKENLGISRALNRGARVAADADYLWFLNNDVRVTPSSLRQLVTHIESKPETGIVFPRINNMGSETIQALGYDYDMFAYRGWPGRDVGKTEPSDSSPHEIVHSMGASMLVDRNVWEDIGGFDERNFIYGDDSYLCLQAWLRGYHVEVVPESVVYHEKEATFSNSTKIAYHELRNKTRTYLKSLQLKTLMMGFPGFFLLLCGQLTKDLLVRRTPLIAIARLWGFVAAIVTLPEILRSRRQINRERVYSDSRFLTPVWENWS